MIEGEVERPGKGNADAIVKRLGVTLDQLEGYELYPFEASHQTDANDTSELQIPLHANLIKLFKLNQLNKYKNITLALSDKDHTLEVSMAQETASPGSHILIKVDDDSMRDTLSIGESVLVDIRKTPKIGNLVLVRINGQHNLRLLGEDNEVHSENPIYKSKSVDPDDILGVATKALRDL